MAGRRESKLTDAKVKATKRPGLFGDGLGLWLQVSETNGRLSKSWIFRFMLNGRPRFMGLGPTHAFSLKEARERARLARQMVIDKKDPIDARNAERLQGKLEAAKSVSFEDACTRYIAAHESGWTHPKHRKQWSATLASTFPVLGKLPVSAVDTPLLLKVLEPMWKATPATASRLRGRIERVLNWATTSGFRTGDNPARWGGHLDQLLAKRKSNSVRHHPALPFDEMPVFMAELRAKDGVTAPALEFAVLTAARTGEVTGATWDEIDLPNKTWSIPAARMKMGKDHRVPLSARALEILESLPREEGNPHVFLGAKAGAPLNPSAMLGLMRPLRPGYVPHGFRSTFRDWAAERTNFASQVIEMALAHAIGDKVEAAYRRGDLFEKRRKLMDAWASFCSTPQASGEVVPFKKAVTS
jgi:integrase